MGIIKAAAGAISSALADQWLEVIEAGEMGDDVVFSKDVFVRKGQNKKNSVDTVSNGSVIHVGPNQFMMLLDGGRLVDYSAEEGYFKVANSSLPSLFNGQLNEAVEESFQRVKYGGVTPSAQRVYFINLQEIKGIRFGTRNPISYFDSFYNCELFLRCHGSYSIKITDPIQFYTEALPHDRDVVRIGDINEQYLDEFLQALQAAINQMSADGVRVSYISTQSDKLSDHMSTILDEKWKALRGIQVQSVGVASLSYDEESQKLINMRNQGAIMSDPSLRESYMQTAVAHGIEAAGSNPGGAMGGFMGVSMGMQAGGGAIGAAAEANAKAAAQAKTNAGWVCACGAQNTGNFCTECGKPRPSQFCPSCGAALPAGELKFCPSCGKSLKG